MKRFDISLTSSTGANSRQHITAYATWLQASHATYTLNRYAQFFVFSIESQYISKCNLTIKSFED